MSIKEIAIWLLSWEVTSVVVVASITIALAVLPMRDFKWAKLFLLLAGVDAIGALSMSIGRADITPSIRYVSGFVLICLIIAITTMGLRYVDKKAQPSVDISGFSNLAEREAELTEINDLICKKSEVELREAFDIPQILQYNIKFAKRNLAPQLISKDESADIDRFFLSGNARLDVRYANIRAINNRAHVDWIPGKIGVINTSAKYAEARNKLASHASSALLPVDVTAALKAFDETIERDSTLMIESLNESLSVDPRNILECDVYGSNWYGSASGLYWRHFVPLRPKADVVASAVRNAIDRH